MNREEARKLPLGEIRKRHSQVIRLDKRGCKVMEIVEPSEPFWLTVQIAIDLYDVGCAAASKAKALGDQQAEDHRLTRCYVDKIRTLICDMRLQ